MPAVLMNSGQKRQHEMYMDWERVVAFHGHTCPGLAVGYRIACIIRRELTSARASDEELLAIIENDACGVDAVQLLLGCTAGKGNLILLDHGKQVYTFQHRESGHALRIAVKPSMMKLNAKDINIRNRVNTGTATEAEREDFQKKRQALIRRILSVPEHKFCEMRTVITEPRRRASILPSCICCSCGESVMEARARIKNGRIVCIPCSENSGS